MSTKESNITSNFNYASPDPQIIVRSHSSSIEVVYETRETLIKQSLQTWQVREKLHNQLRTLGQKYVNMLLGGDREKTIDHVYDVYLSENGMMLDNKYFNEHRHE